MQLRLTLQMTHPRKYLFPPEGQSSAVCGVVYSYFERSVCSGYRQSNSGGSTCVNIDLLKDDQGEKELCILYSL